MIEVYRNTQHVPFAIVQSYDDDDGDTFVICLIDTIYMMRHGIHIGSTLTLKDRLYIVSVDHKVHGTWTNDNEMDTFGQWFMFKEYFESKIGHKRTILLFNAGLRTVDNVRESLRTMKILSIKGIGAYGAHIISRALG